MGWRGFLGVVVAILALTAWGARATAQETAEPEAALDQIREMVLYARYDEAQEQVEAVLTREDLDPSQRNAALEIKATILVARNQMSAAREVLTLLYQRDPEHRLLDRDASPRVRAAFERAHDQAGEAASVTIANDTPDALPTRRPPVISVRLAEGADRAQEVRLSYRFGGEGTFERVMMRFAETRTETSARIPPAEGSEAYEVEYYVEALAPSRAVVGTLGSRDEPLRLAIPEAALVDLRVRDDGQEDDARLTDETEPEPDGGGIATKWWFWTLVGVVVIGAGVGVGLGVSQPGQPDPGSLGEGRLR